MRSHRSIVAMVALSLTTLVALPVQAELKLKKKKGEVYVPKKVAAAKVRETGWDGSLTLGVSISLASSHQVVGQADGESLSLTGQVTGGLDYIKGMHEWRNVLKLSETSAKTPGIDRFVKSNDLLSLDSLYLMIFKKLPWFGPYARFQWRTTLFPTEDVRTSDVTYIAKDGSALPGTNPRNFLRLADAFSPMSFRETLGAFAKPYTTPALAVEFKLGFQGKQTVVSGDTFVVNDDDKTAEIEVDRLANVIQGGPSAGVLLRGKIYDKKVSYFLDAEAMIPVLNDLPSGDDRNAAELTNIIVDAGISVKVFSWMSLDYSFRLLRDPQLVDATQIQNNILLTFAYSFFESAQTQKK